MTSKKKICLIVLLIFAVISVLSIWTGTIKKDSVVVEIDRYVYLKVVADKEYVKACGENWEDRIRTVVGMSSWDFGRQFGVELIIGELKEWSSKKEPTYDKNIYLDRLKEEIEPGDCDIVVAFTGKPFLFTLGMAEVLGRHLFTTDPVIKFSFVSEWEESRKASFFREEGNLFRRPHLTLTHELGHIFGAFHSPDPQSVMNIEYENIGKWTTGFDKGNIKLIGWNKYRNFHDEKYLPYSASTPN